VGRVLALMNTFSTAEIARILDVSPEWVRAQARVSLISPTRTSRGHFRYSFRDVLLLRTARGLRCADISARRISMTLASLSRGLPSGTNMSSLKLLRRGKEIVARDRDTVWNPATGQMQLEFGRPVSSDVCELPSRSYRVRETNDACDWFELGLEYEHHDSNVEAEAAYRRACELDPEHINARINLGRLRHAVNVLEEAESLYREALDIDPRHPIALFNLGVVLEDRGALASAIESYKLAIDTDPDIPEAHYNLARLYVKQSEDAEAIRHYARYKSLMRGKET
jgi:DNA-binding transcriptional MerR regulator